MAQHGRRVQIEGALLVTLLPIGVVVDPDIGYAQVLDGQKAVLIAERGQVSRETHQARINLGHRRPVSGFQVVVPGVEVEPDAVVQQRAPKGSVDLPLRHAGQAIERRPAIEEVALGRQAFAEGAQETRRQAALSVDTAYSVQLMSPIAAVLLPFPTHAVGADLLGTVVQCVEGRVEEFLQLRIAAVEMGGVPPGKQPPPHAHVAEHHGALGVAHVNLQPRSDS